MLAGIVAAGERIEPIPQTERVEVPKSMLGRGDSFALRVKGTSMRDDGILPGDVVVVQKRSTARNSQTVIALVNGEATIKIYHRKAGSVDGFWMIQGSFAPEDSPLVVKNPAQVCTGGIKILQL